MKRPAAANKAKPDAAAMKRLAALKRPAAAAVKGDKYIVTWNPKYTGKEHNFKNVRYKGGRKFAEQNGEPDATARQVGSIAAQRAREVYKENN